MAVRSSSERLTILEESFEPIEVKAGIFPVLFWTYDPKDRRVGPPTKALIREKLVFGARAR